MLICSSEGGVGFDSVTPLLAAGFRERLLFTVDFLRVLFFPREDARVTLSVWTSLDFFGTDYAKFEIEFPVMEKIGKRFSPAK